MECWCLKGVWKRSGGVVHIAHVGAGYVLQSPEHYKHRNPCFIGQYTEHSCKRLQRSQGLQLICTTGNWTTGIQLPAVRSYPIWCMSTLSHVCKELMQDESYLPSPSQSLWRSSCALVMWTLNRTILIQVCWKCWHFTQDERWILAKPKLQREIQLHKVQKWLT